MRFLLALSTAAAVVAATSHSASSTSRPHKRADIDDCLADAGVPVDEIDSDDWELDASPFNDRLPYIPAAIAAPTSVEHIQAAVSCAAKLGIKVSPKSGGHSYASFGLGGEDGHLVVQLDRMDNVTLDAETNIATVQPGARLGHVATLLNDQGKRGFSHGTCPGVGVGGHSIHGGFGFSSHTHGLAVDWIAGATVVLANGTAVKTSATENPDLFWAIRGAGSSFGIVSEFQFNTFAVPDNVTSFEINLPWKNATNITAGWSAIQDYLLAGDMDPLLNMRVLGNGYQTQIQGLYHGNKTACNETIQPLVKLVNGTLTKPVEYDWMGGISHYGYSQEVDLTRPYSQSETFYSKSLVTSALPAEVLQKVADYWVTEARNVTRSWYIIIDFYGGPTSAVTKVAAEDTSYAYRDPENSLFLYELYDRSFGDYPDDGFAFLDGWVDAFTSGLEESQWGMYVNYADPTMDREQAQQVYYRQSLPRLRDIKKAVDPDEVFYYPQAVEPAKPADPAK
ncbi:hypothetical protein B0J18DRAFT_296543 [Chaetomium sp. MPI-SDFR-AT-0129]|nr:hypothetical protein B0J18DRAFT_296543 [Chaetomium sp. MPI-SDFR-AT-0129]